MQFNLITIVAGVIMAICFVGMIFCAKKQQVSPIAKPIAVALMIVVMSCAVVILYNTGIFGDPSVAKFMKNEEIYIRSKSIVLGKYLAGKTPGAKALLVVDNIPNNKMQEQVIAALREGMGSQITIVAEDSPTAPPAITDPLPAPEAGTPEAGTEEGATPTPPPAPAAPTPPPPGGGPGMPPNFMEMRSLRESMKAVDFDAMMKRHPDCNLIISLIGLPMDIENMEIWYAEETPEAPKPKIALMDANIYNLKAAILSGIVVGTVTYSPTAKFDESTPPEDVQQAFDKRFLLITPENVEAVATQYTGLFQAQP